VRSLSDVSGVEAVVIRHVTVIVFLHQRQIVHEHMLRNFQHCQQLTALEYRVHGSLSLFKLRFCLLHSKLSNVTALFLFYIENHFFSFVFAR